MTGGWLTRDSRGVDMIIVTGSILARVDTFDDVRRSCLEHVEGSKAFVRSLKGRIVETSGTKIYRAQAIPR
jgi:hypothetical protein